MNNTDVFNVLDHRANFWDAFEKKYEEQQAYANEDYGLLTFHKHWPGASQEKILTRRKSQHDLLDECLKESTEEKEEASDSTLTQSSWDKWDGSHVKKNITSNTCNAKTYSTQVCAAKSINSLELHGTLAVDTANAAQRKSKKTAVKIQSKYKQLQEHSEHQMHKHMQETDSSSSIVKQTFSSRVNNKIKYTDKNRNMKSTAIHIMENTTSPNCTITAETQRFTGIQSHLEKEDSLFSTQKNNGNLINVRRNMNGIHKCCQDACIHNTFEKENNPLNGHITEKLICQQLSSVGETKKENLLDKMIQIAGNSRTANNGIETKLTVLGNNTCKNSDHSLEQKQKDECCSSKSLSKESKTPVKLTSPPCSSNSAERIQIELLHSIKSAKEKQNRAANILEFSTKHLTESCRAKKSNTHFITENLYESTSEENTNYLGNKSTGKAIKTNHSSNCDQENKDRSIQEAWRDSFTKVNNSTIESRDEHSKHINALQICKSKTDICDSNETNTYKFKPSNLPDSQSTISRSKHQNSGKDVPPDGVQKKAFTECNETKHNPNTARKLCNISDTPSNEVNYMVKEILPNKLAAPNSCENSVANMVEILEKQRKKIYNKTSQVNRIANVSNTSTVQTRKTNTKTVLCTSAAKSSKSNEMNVHQEFSPWHNPKRNGNDLHAREKTHRKEDDISTLFVKTYANTHSLYKQCSASLLQRNENKTDRTPIMNTAFSKDLCSNNDYKTFEKENDLKGQIIEKSMCQVSSVDEIRAVRSLNKMVQSSENASEKYLPPAPTEYRCGNKFLAKQELVGNYTFFITKDSTEATVSEDMLEKLRKRSKRCFRKKLTRFMERVLSHKSEQQNEDKCLQRTSPSEIRHFTVTEDPKGSANKDKKLEKINKDLISNGEVQASCFRNRECTNKIDTLNAMWQRSKEEKQLQSQTGNSESNSRNIKDNIVAGPTALYTSTNSGPVLLEQKQKVECHTSKRLDTKSKTPVKLISQSCSSISGEKSVQTELYHCFENPKDKQIFPPNILKCRTKRRMQCSREEKSTITHCATEKVCENASDKNTNHIKNKAIREQVKKSPTNICNQLNEDLIIIETPRDTVSKRNNSMVKYTSEHNAAREIFRSKMDICENNEINSNNLPIAQSTGSQSKHQHVETIQQGNHTRRKITSENSIWSEVNNSEMKKQQTNPLTYKSTNIQNRTLEKSPSHPLLHSKKCTRNVKVHNLAQLNRENKNSLARNAANGSTFHSTATEQSHQELCEQIRLRNNPPIKSLSSEIDLQIKGNIKDDCLESSTKMYTLLATPQQKYTAKEFESIGYALKGMGKRKTSNPNTNDISSSRVSGSKQQQHDQIQVNIKRRKLSDAKAGARVNLVLESSVCSSDHSESRQQESKCSVSGGTHTSRRKLLDAKAGASVNLVLESSVCSSDDSESQQQESKRSVSGGTRTSRRKLMDAKASASVNLVLESNACSSDDSESRQQESKRSVFGGPRTSRRKPLDAKASASVNLVLESSACSSDHSESQQQESKRSVFGGPRTSRRKPLDAKAGASVNLVLESSVCSSDHSESQQQESKHSVSGGPHTSRRKPLDAKASASVNLVLESSACSSDHSESQLQESKRSVFGGPHTSSRASYKPLSELLACTSVPSIEDLTSLSSSDYIASKMFTNFSSGSWSVFTTKLFNDLDMPLPKGNKKFRLFYRK